MHLRTPKKFAVLDTFKAQIEYIDDTLEVNFVRVTDNTSAFLKCFKQVKNEFKTEDTKCELIWAHLSNITENDSPCGQRFSANKRTTNKLQLKKGNCKT